MLTLDPAEYSNVSCSLYDYVCHGPQSSTWSLFSSAVKNILCGGVCPQPDLRYLKLIFPMDDCTFAVTRSPSCTAGCLWLLSPGYLHA